MFGRSGAIAVAALLLIPLAGARVAAPLGGLRRRRLARDLRDHARARGSSRRSRTSSRSRRRGGSRASSRSGSRSPAAWACSRRCSAASSAPLALVGRDRPAVAVSRATSATRSTTAARPGRPGSRSSARSSPSSSASGASARVETTAAARLGAAAPADVRLTASRTGRRRRRDGPSPLTPGLVARAQDDRAAGRTSSTRTSSRATGSPPPRPCTSATRLRATSPTPRRNRPYVRRDAVAPVQPDRRPRDPEALRRDVARDRPRPLRHAARSCRSPIATGASPSTGFPSMSSALEPELVAAPRRRAARDRARLVGVLPLARLPRRRSRTPSGARSADADARRWSLLAAVVIQAVYVAQARPLAADRRHARAHACGASTRSCSAGIGANNVLPLRIGDILRARWLATSAEIPTGPAFGSVFRDRACDVLTLVVALVAVAAVRRRCRLGGADRGRGRRPARRCSRSSSLAASSTRARGRGPGASTRSRARKLLRDTIDELASPIGRRTILLALALSAVAWGIWAVRGRARLPVARHLPLARRARLRHRGDQPRGRDPELARVHRHLPVARRLGARRRRRRRRRRDRVLAPDAGGLVHPDDARRRRDRDSRGAPRRDPRRGREREPPVPSPR